MLMIAQEWLDFEDAPDYGTGIPLDVLNPVLSVLDVAPESRRLSFLDRDFAGLPTGSDLAQLHASFYYKQGKVMEQMSPAERGRYGAQLLLEDWIKLAQATENGLFTSVAGFEGRSPLAQPVTLRHLGAKVRPTILDHREGAIATHGHELMTGKHMPNRKAHQFIISKTALIESIPVAESYLDRLSC